ncbi:ABC transporter substrate-binding protein [Leeuwenhoekiella sp. NPDC079379]|uniref:ABC transporter substrate-binding protein n=1 Tax=Leeuwenhoekiella sp. NPDC079379 TaxID=3364122 RepID=UPI0037C7DE65
MFRLIKYKLILLLILIAISCGSENKKNELNLKSADWETITDSTAGKTVNFMMWQGSPVINDYINNYVIPTVKERYGITLQISGGQGPEIVQLVMGEKQADIKDSQVDMVWINGETFFQLRKLDGLWGPFVEKLPNSKFIDFEDPFISTDFQQPINYMECPWSISQFAMVTDTVQVPNPPRNLRDLEVFLKENKESFTISNDFTGMTLLKAFMAELGGGPSSLDGPFDQEKYDTLSTQLWEYINRNKKYFWKKGETFPKEQTKMKQLFANGEIKIAYGYGEGGIEENVRTGLFPKSVKGYAWDNGTIKNANYLGILQNAPQKAAAMQVINFLISPEAQLKKADPAGMNSNMVLELDRLPEEWLEVHAKNGKRKYGPSMQELEDHAIAEPAPEYMIKLYEDFRTAVIEK